MKTNSTPGGPAFGFMTFPKKEEKEDFTEKLLSFFSNEMGLSFQVDNIDRSHCMGKKRQDGGWAIIVKFKSYSSKKKCDERKAKQTGKDYFVYEDLTFVNCKILQMAKEEYHDNPVRTIDGQVFVSVDSHVQAYVPSADINKRLLCPPYVK